MCIHIREYQVRYIRGVGKSERERMRLSERGKRHYKRLEKKDNMTMKRKKDVCVLGCARLVCTHTLYDAHTQTRAHGVRYIIICAYVLCARPAAIHTTDNVLYSYIVCTVL